jgi:hypothetical protein
MTTSLWFEDVVATSDGGFASMSLLCPRASYVGGDDVPGR